VHFDPENRFGPYEDHNPTGFAANTLYTVTLPGTDEGAIETVRSKGGRPLARTFRTTFRTGSAYNFFYSDTPEFTDGAPPTVDWIEASDAPGVPLEGRNDVDRGASILVRFSGTILRSSFNPRLRIRLPFWHSGTTIRFRGRLSEDGTTFTFRPRRPLPPGVPVVFYYPSGLAGRSGSRVPEVGPVPFQAASSF
jgi:hypothetical protein